jgi:hypothetical protein
MTIHQNVPDFSSLGDAVVLDWSLLQIEPAVAQYADDLSSEQLEYEDRKLRLMTLIDSMIDCAPSWDGESTFVTADAAATAIRFLSALPSNRSLPKVAPDGEGDILFVWEPPNGNCVVTVEDQMLHLVDQPGTRYVEHVDAVPFYGRRIPISILRSIPMK